MIAVSYTCHIFKPAYKSTFDSSELLCWSNVVIKLSKFMLSDPLQIENQLELPFITELIPRVDK